MCVSTNFTSIRKFLRGFLPVFEGPLHDSRGCYSDGAARLLQGLHVILFCSVQAGAFLPCFGFGRWKAYFGIVVLVFMFFGKYRAREFSYRFE